MGLLRNFHKHAGRWALPHDDVDRKLAINAVRYAKDEAARAQQTVGFGDVLADQIGHIDFTAMDGDAHGRDGAEKRCCRQDEDQQRHPAYPFESFSESHASWPFRGFRWLI